jgi:hypothetical protein
MHGSRNGSHEHHHHGSDTQRSQESPRPGLGHNHADAREVVQWQVPHRADGGQVQSGPEPGEPDLDKVETAFAHGFTMSADPTSFLRLANVPFEAVASDGKTLVLLRVEVDAVVDIGSVMPHLGGASFRYDPLPESMVTKRQRLRFVYFDGADIRSLSFAELRAIAPPAAG